MVQSVCCTCPLPDTHSSGSGTPPPCCPQAVPPTCRPLPASRGSSQQPLASSPGPPEGRGSGGLSLSLRPVQDRIQQCSSLSHLASVLDRDLRLLRPLEHRGLVLDIAFKALSLCPHAARLAEPLGPTRPINKAAITVLSFIQGLMPDVLRYHPGPQYLMLPAGPG